MSKKNKRKKEKRYKRFDIHVRWEGKWCNLKTLAPPKYHSITFMSPCHSLTSHEASEWRHWLLQPGRYVDKQHNGRMYVRWEGGRMMSPQDIKIVGVG